MSFKKIALLFFLFTISGMADLKAQLVLEATTTPESFILESWWSKPLDEAYKFGLFNLSSLEHNYAAQSTNFLSYTVVNITLWNGLGPVVGSRILADRFVGIGGIQYTYLNDLFFVYVNFTTELRSKPDFELYSIIQYRPKLSERLKGFAQGQFSFNFNSDTHLFSFQQIRLGVDFGGIQTGVAFNNFQFDQSWDYDFQPGLFFRFEFND